MVKGLWAHLLPGAFLYLAHEIEKMNHVLQNLNFEAVLKPH